MKTTEAKTIYLIRHPETMAGEGVCYGQTDVDVAPKVLEKAVAKVKGKLNGVRANSCYSSPLQRCAKLAEALFDRENIIYDARLKELDFGRWEMQRWDALPEEDLSHWAKDFMHSHQHGGESYCELQQRFAAFWQMLSSHADEPALVVTHSGIIRAFLAQSLDASVSKVFSIQVDYADVIEVLWYHDDYQEIRFL